MGYKRKTVEFRDNNDCNKVVAYYRYSSSKQTEQSIERQIQIVEDFCAYKGLEIVAAYKDEEKSGMFLSIKIVTISPKKINPYVSAKG